MSADATPLLTARDLGRTLSERASVSGINLSLQRGDILGLLGLNGAGKSTTLQLLCGVLACDTGSVSVAGHDLQQEPLLARARIGFLPDQPPLYPELRVSAYLHLCAKLRRVPRRLQAQRVDAVIGQCQLTEVASLRIAELSKGYRQRVGLAQALVHQPDVVLLDEPSNGLDPQQMDEMRSLIRELSARQSVIFSTHLLVEAQAVCTRIAILHQGRLLADRPANGKDLEALFHQVVNSSVAVGAIDTQEPLPTSQSKPSADATALDNTRDAHA